MSHNLTIDLDLNKNRVGRPPTINRKITKSSQEGLPNNWTRATFIVREDLLKRLKDYANTDNQSLKNIVNKILEDFLEKVERKENK